MATSVRKSRANRNSYEHTGINHICLSIKLQNGREKKSEQ